MKFGPVPVAEAEGAVAAHSVRMDETVLRKGVRISRADIEALARAGVAEIVVARLEPGDLDENAAAARLAAALTGPGLRTEPPFTGRVNIFAEASGVLRIDEAAAARFNSVDEAITLATLPACRAVEAGELVATVKIIPYGVAEAAVVAAAAALGPATPLRLAAYCARRLGVISTLLPGLKPSVVDKTLKVLAGRLAPAGATIEADRRVAHAVVPLAAALRERAASDDELIVVFGASAITDRRDVIPAALVAAGGAVEHLGMPVDPGNLLMLGRLGGKPVIGAPGCARSPKENGFDWVLQRLLADVPVGRAEIQAMGVGGLLMEIVSRPQPRASDPGGAARVAAVVLAAGRSTRMGGPNKLLAEVSGKPLVRHAVEAALASPAGPVLVVTGHEADAVAGALAGLDVRLIHNPEYASGIASSLRVGIAALPPEVGAALVLLGDMPKVTPAILARLIAAHQDAPQAIAVAPTLLGRRGNPVLLARSVFARLLELSGDEGARRLLATTDEPVVEVPIDDPAVALDIDTPEALAALK